MYIIIFLEHVKFQLSHCVCVCVNGVASLAIIAIAKSDWMYSSVWRVCFTGAKFANLPKSVPEENVAILLSLVGDDLTTPINLTTTDPHLIYYSFRKKNLLVLNFVNAGQVTKYEIYPLYGIWCVSVNREVQMINALNYVHGSYQ